MLLSGLSIDKFMWTLLLRASEIVLAKFCAVEASNWMICLLSYSFYYFPSEVTAFSVHARLRAQSDAFLILHSGNAMTGILMMILLV